MSSQQNTFKQRLTHCLSCFICSLVKKPRANPVFTSRLPLLFGLYNLYTNHSGQGDGERERADAISCVFNFDLWNAKVIKVCKNFPGIWHRHGQAGSASLRCYTTCTQKTLRRTRWTEITRQKAIPRFFPSPFCQNLCPYTPAATGATGTVNVKSHQHSFW